MQVALATHPETRKPPDHGRGEGRVVTLEGGTAALDRAVEVARSVPGVRLVKTQKVEIPADPAIRRLTRAIALRTARHALLHVCSRTFERAAKLCFHAGQG